MYPGSSRNRMGQLLYTAMKLSMKDVRLHVSPHTHLEVDAELGVQGHAVQAVQVLAEQLRQLLPGALLKQRRVRLARRACALGTAHQFLCRCHWEHERGSAIITHPHTSTA